MLFPANFNFKAGVIDVAKLVDRPWCAPSGIEPALQPPLPNRVFSADC